MIIKGINNLTDEQIARFLYSVYEIYFPNQSYQFVLDSLGEINKDISLAYYLDHELVALLILKEENEPTKTYQGRGLRGDALAVKDSFQKKGLGKEIVSYVKDNFKDYDYLWGTQAFVLKNEGFLQKHAKLFHSDNKRNYYIFINKEF